MRSICLDGGVRILLLTPMPPHPSAPGAIPVLLNAELIGLAERHDVTVVTVAGPERHELEAVIALRTAGMEVHAVERWHGERSRWTRRRRKSVAWLRGQWPWRTVWYWEPEAQQVIDRLVSKGPFDVILAEDNAMGIYRLPEGPLRVLTEYEVRRARRVARPPASPTVWPWWALREADWVRWPRYQRSVWRRFDLLQVFSDRDAEAVRAMAPELGERVRVNPFAIVLPELLSTDIEPGTVVFLGNFLHLPNVDAAVWLGRDIMPRLRALRPGVHLVVAGIHPPPEVKALVAPDIAVPGFVADADDLMRGAAVVVAPVRTGGGMRMKVLHAMALGKAVVTTTRGAEGLTTGGRRPPVAIADDADGFARLTAGLLADPSARDELGAAARSFVAAHHSPLAYATRFEAIVDRRPATTSEPTRRASHCQS